MGVSLASYRLDFISYLNPNYHCRSRLADVGPDVENGGFPVRGVGQQVWEHTPPSPKHCPLHSCTPLASSSPPGDLGRLVWGRLLWDLTPVCPAVAPQVLRSTPNNHPPPSAGQTPKRARFPGVIPTFKQLPCH